MKHSRSKQIISTSEPEFEMSLMQVLYHTYKYQRTQVILTEYVVHKEYRRLYQYSLCLTALKSF